MRSELLWVCNHGSRVLSLLWKRARTFEQKWDVYVTKREKTINYSEVELTKSSNKMEQKGNKKAPRFTTQLPLSLLHLKEI